MNIKLPKHTQEEWQDATEAIMNEYEDFTNELRQRGVDYTIKNARKLLIYQDLIIEWQHNIKTIISDFEDNTFALTVFEDLQNHNQSFLLKRGYETIATWPDFKPSALGLWLELEEDIAL